MLPKNFPLSQFAIIFMVLFWSGVESYPVPMNRKEYHTTEDLPTVEDPSALVTFAPPASKESLDSGTIAAECSYSNRFIPNSSNTRNNNCSHAILLACPRNQRWEDESPLRFQLLKEPTGNLFLYATILVISGCLAFGLYQWGRNRIANGKDIGIFLRVFSHRLENQDSHKKNRNGRWDQFYWKTSKSSHTFFQILQHKETAVW